jgi:hypothetical protein
VDIWSEYDVADVTVDHPTFTLTDWLIALFAGVLGTGAPISVVKYRLVDQALVPLAFVAFTHQ